ncbi:hypothetical protein U1Q18_005294 [Sarracenia purpurea var. burkii]
MGADQDIYGPASRHFCNSLHLIILLLSLVLLNFGIPCIADWNGGSSSSFSSSMAKFTPADNYLINCGSPETTHLDDGRTFESDPQSASLLSTDKNILTSVNSIPNAVSFSPSSPSSLPLYLTARIFPYESTYRFPISNPGRHWLRLYFYPLPNPTVDLAFAAFSVTTDNFLLLHWFSAKDNTPMAFKEYLINITSDGFSLKFSPFKNSFAFINAIELISAPDGLIPDSVSELLPTGDFTDLSDRALEVSYRLNVGGPVITPKNDTLGRTWLPDIRFMTFPQGAKNVFVPTNSIKYSVGSATPFTAPSWVYATAEEMADPGVVEANFNLTWVMAVDPSYSYLIRMHFCDIVSQALNELYFSIYVNGVLGVSSLDLSTLTSGLSIPYYTDFVVNSSTISKSSIMVQVGPVSDALSSAPNAILNGLEVMKMSSSYGSLDGGQIYSNGGYRGPNSEPSTTQISAAVGVVTAILLLGIGTVRWRQQRRRRRCPDWNQKRGSFSSWLLPINGTQFSSLSSKSKSSYSSFDSSAAGLGLSLGRFFTLTELRNATRNFDESAVIGVGGFGKVYLGEMEDGTKLAVKRGNPSSAQGINEFQTEIEMLSKLRHRHLVSLVGYCNEQSEMILVYEYMANGPLRDHLYAAAAALRRPPLSWTQRLEICIGAARGLHYLHTGSAQGVIHRDVKTTNILLDGDFVAKVSDFGLSKSAPSLEETHVSTAVKGSFGYLDPEYFRRQQLTEKSDVYSFGVVLFEVLCARPALDPSLPRDEVNLAEWAVKQISKKEGWSAEEIMDRRLIGEDIISESVMKYAEAAEKCVAENGVERPSMGDVLWSLELALQLQEASSKLDPILQEDDDGDGEEAMDLKPPRKLDFQPHGHGGLDIIGTSDDSGVLVGSPLFLQDFQGR